MAGTLLSVELEHSVPGLPPGFDSNDGLLVDSVFGDLSSMAARLGVTPLRAFTGQAWFAAADGIATVRALRDEVVRDPAALMRSQWVLVRLAIWEASLVAADAASTRWRVRAELA